MVGICVVTASMPVRIRPITLITSYAVQNTYKMHMSPILTPRVMNLFVLRNVELIFWLTHIQFQIAKYNQLFNFYKVPCCLYWIAPHFFAPQSFLIFRKLYLRNTYSFTTNLYKSEVFWFFQTLIHHFEVQESNVYTLTPTINSLSVQYYKPVTTSDIIFNKKKYTNVTMYILVFLLDTYHSLTIHHQTHFNFWLITPVFWMLKYLNRYLFKIYNF